MSVKECSGCGVEKSLDLFNKSSKSKDGYTSQCKDCVKAKGKAFRENHKETIKDDKKFYAERNKARYDRGSIIVPKEKFCKKCNKVKLREDYSIDKSKPDGLFLYCKDCNNAYSKELRERDIEESREKARKYREEHREQVSAAKKRHYQKHKEHIIKRVKDYGAKPEIKEKHKVYGREYNKRRRRTDPDFKLISYQRGRVQKKIKKNEKSAATKKLIGCEVSIARKYIESQFYPNPETGEEMTWENNTKYGWNVEHAIPLDVFDFSDPVEQHQAFNVSNMQPMWYKDHMRKHNIWGDNAPEGVTLESLMAKYLKWKEEYDKSNS